MKPIIAAALIAFIAQGPEAQPAETVSLQARLDRMFVPWTKGNVPGCAAGVTQAGSWLARGGYGSASLEHGARITPDTVFYTASVSKQFTAAALLRLVDRGLAGLDDDVRRHIPELPEYTPPITLRHLVHHTSGLPDYLKLLIEEGGGAVDVRTTREIMAMLATKQPLFPAGLGHSYSNTNYLLIGEVVRRASGKSLRDFAQETLFAPLGMRDTRYYDDRSEVVPRYASAYFEHPRGSYRIVKTLYAQVGAGGLLTTVNDLGKWARVFDNPQAIPESPRLGQRMMERGKLSDGTTIDYAFGLGLAKEHGHDVAQHNGAFSGFITFFTWIPDKRMAVFALCNWADAPITTIQANMLGEALQ